MINSQFPAYFKYCNQSPMKHFKRYVFHPGMLFNSCDKWWGDLGKRASVHEGIDLCCFENKNGCLNVVDSNFKIPATFDGKVVKMEKDFLGTSITLRHEIQNNENKNLYTIYGHVTPENKTQTGKTLLAGETLALVKDFPIKKSRMRPHLHLSFAWADKGIEISRLTWPNLHKDQEITLINPLELMDIEKQVSKDRWINLN